MENIEDIIYSILAYIIVKTTGYLSYKEQK
jgi:hypothetical protein